MKVEYKITFEPDGFTVTQSLQQEPSDGGGTGLGPDPDDGGRRPGNRAVTESAQGKTSDGGGTGVGPDPDDGGQRPGNPTVAVVFGPVIVTSAGAVVTRTVTPPNKKTLVHDARDVAALRKTRRK